MNMRQLDALGKEMIIPDPSLADFRFHSQKYRKINCLVTSLHPLDVHPSNGATCGDGFYFSSCSRGC